MASLLLIPVLFVVLIGFIWPKVATPFVNAIEWGLRRFISLPKKLEGDILPAFLRVMALNWYTIGALLLLFIVLFLTDVGKDMIVAYLDNLMAFTQKSKGRFPSIFGTYSFVFLTTFSLSLAIWIIPFYLYSPATREEIRHRFKQYYLSTKFLAFFAMGPFFIVTNAFLYHTIKQGNRLMILLGINAIIFVLFLVLTAALRKGFIAKHLENWYGFLSKKIRNGYNRIFLTAAIFIIGLILVFTLISVAFAKPSAALLAKNLFVFNLLASFIVFILFIFSNEEGVNPIEKIRQLVESMINPDKAHFSKFTYRSVFWVLIGINIFYYLLPSLEPVNTLYILLVAFSFFIMYFDYFRNLMKNRIGHKRTLAVLATVVLVISSFLTSKNQFRVRYTETGDSYAISLEDALKARVRQIIKEDAGKDIFIVCAMGGGSRAGYITAASLASIDEICHGKDSLQFSKLWEQTLCYSTISGGSVGTYHYLKGKIENRLPTDKSFLPYLYKKNYNSSGVFGLFIGDPVETLFRGVATTLRRWSTGEKPLTGFFDRNYRVRQEYDYILQQALMDSTAAKEDYKFLRKALHPKKSGEIFEYDYFKTLFHQKNQTLPIHLVNTFEVNKGKRAILSPFPVSSKKFFPNSILPLQDKDFTNHPQSTDIRYREAVNMSELFPLVSAASYMGDNDKAQFVDGGYYENYGLAAAMDIYYFLKNDPYFTDSLKLDIGHVKILLIKNSKQEAKYSGRQIQLLAPLIGAMNAPFTGHANHMEAEATRILGKERFLTLTFDAAANKVPLTRALNQNHIEAMDTYVNGLNGNDELLMFLKRK